MWCWRRREKISWTDRVENEVLQEVKKERNIVHTIKQRKAKWIGHLFHGNCFLKHVVERKIQGTIRRERGCKHVLYDLKKKRRYWNFKEEALDVTHWRTRFGRGCELIERYCVGKNG
jgi:hypothetical protein